MFGTNGSKKLLKENFGRFFNSYPCWSRLPSAVSRKNNVNFLHNIDQISGWQLKRTYGGKHP